MWKKEAFSKRKLSCRLLIDCLLAVGTFKRLGDKDTFLMSKHVLNCKHVSRDAHAV